MPRRWRGRRYEDGLAHHTHGRNPLEHRSYGDRRRDEDVGYARQQEVPVLDFDILVAGCGEEPRGVTLRERHLVRLQVREPSEIWNAKNGVDVRVVEVGLDEYDPATGFQQAAHVRERITKVVIQVMEDSVSDDGIERLAFELSGVIEIEYGKAKVR